MLLADTDFAGVAQIITAVASLVSVILAGVAALYAAAAKLAANATKSDVATMSTGLSVVKENVQKIEIATNSMKDALVEATKVAGLAEGEKVGRAAQKSEMKSDLALP